MQGVVVVQQQAAPVFTGVGGSAVYLPLKFAKNNPWRTGICDCFADCGVCIKAYFCLCCLIADNAARMDGESPTCGCCYPACCCSSPLRNRYQAMGLFGIQPSCMDCFFGVCCGCCSEMQVAREIAAIQNMQMSGPGQQVMTTAAAAY